MNDTTRASPAPLFPRRAGVVLRPTAAGTGRVCGAGLGMGVLVVLSLIVAPLPLAAQAEGSVDSPASAAVPAIDDPEMRVLLLEQPFPYEAKDVALTELLHEMSQKTSLPIVVGDGVSGRADVSNVGGSVRQLLDRLSDDGRVRWWFDGAAVHVEGPVMVSRLLPLQGVHPSDLREALRAIGLTANEYPMLAGGDARMVRIVAPQGYVDAVEQTIAALAAEVAPKAPAALPIIIRGPGRARPQRDPRGWDPRAVDPGYNAPYPGAAPAAPYQTDPRKESR